MINSDEKLFFYCGLFGQVLKENGKERLKVFIVYKDNISLREKEIWILLESLYEIVFFPLCCYARVWEIESVRSNKCNESSCQNNTNTLNFFWFITHKPVCNTAQLGITFMNCWPKKKVQSQIWISEWVTHYSKAFYGDFERSNISSTLQWKDYLHSKFNFYKKWTWFSLKKLGTLLK